MKYIFGVIFTLYIGTLSVYAQSKQSQVKQFTLSEALKYALSNNPAFRNALLEERISEEKVKEAGNALLPKLTGSIDTRYNTQIATQVLPARTFNPMAAEGELTTAIFGTNWNASAALDLNAPILDFGASANIDYAKAAQNLASANAAQSRNTLTLNVMRAYYAVLLNQEKLRQAETTLTRNENFYKDVQTRFQNANALKTDFSTAYLNASNAQLQRRKAADAVNTSLANLALQLGYEGNAQELTLTDNLTSMLANDTTFANASNDEAFQARTDVRAELAQREMSVQAMQRTTKQSYPSLSGYGFLGTQGFANDISRLTFFPISYLGLRVNIPLSDWFTRTPLVQQQSLQLDKNENTLTSLRQTLRYELENTQTTLKNAFRAAMIQKENIAIAEEIVSTTTTRFKQGQATQQDVLNAEETFRNTQASYLQAVYDVLVAKLDWEKANGNL
jgi:outer membrane protein TolC